MSPELPQNIKLGQIRRTAGIATPSEWSKLSRDEQEAVDALHDQKNLLAAFLVLPNTRAASSREPEYLQIVPVGDLERNCERFRLD